VNSDLRKSKKFVLGGVKTPTCKLNDIREISIRRNHYSNRRKQLSLLELIQVHLREAFMRRIPVKGMVIGMGIILATGCNNKDEKSNPFSLVDNYRVNPVEAEGTVYSGDFFPIKAGYECNYSGYATVSVSIKEEDINETMDGPALGMLKVLALRPIPLPGGTVDLYPIVDLSSMEFDMESEVTADTSRFFMKDAQAVYIKALKLSDGSYMEVKNPIYIKSKLVVGDSWETAPKMDMTKLLSSELGVSGSASNLDLDAKAKFFVVGEEEVTLPVGKRTGIRVDHVSVISLTGNLSVEGISARVNVSGKLVTVYHMIADTGIVKQVVSGPISIAISADGQRITLTMDFNDLELGLTGIRGGESKTDTLVSYVKGGSAKRSIHQVSAAAGVTETETMDKMHRLSFTIAKSLVKGLCISN
jgi:hypothetical protein